MALPLERPAGAARNSALTGLNDLEKKVQSHLRKREATELAQIARARTAVLPGGKPQERVLTAPGWLARYGFELIPNLRDHAARWYSDALAARAVAS